MSPRQGWDGGGGGGGGEGRRSGPPPGSALPFLNWSLIPVTVASGKGTVRREKGAVRTISPSSPGAGPGRARPAEQREGRGRERPTGPACLPRWMTVRWLEAKWRSLANAVESQPKSTWRPNSRGADRVQESVGPGKNWGTSIWKSWYPVGKEPFVPSERNWKCTSSGAWQWTKEKSLLK